MYDEAVTEGLVVLWEASDRVCGKRLKALLPILVPALERHGHLTLDARVREQLMAVSAATIDRRLAPARAVTAGQRRRRRAGGDRVRGRVPVRTFSDWQDPAPGFVEADLVAHCGSSMAGSFVWTLVLTDIASGWTECVPLLVREAGAVVDALDRLRRALPFPLRGVDTDNGSEFLNEVLIGFCKEHGIELTRSRPYRKNDQAWVEQKNGAVVRRLVGYGRLEGMPGAEALARLYSAARLFVNVFQPSFKLAEKTRVGARVHKRYHAPETPCARLLASDTVSAAMKDRLRALAGTLDPLGLLDEIRAVQHHLAGLAAGSTVHPMPQRDADLDGFLRSLALAWRAGEVRPTHRPRKRPPRHWRTRKDPFETTWPRVVEWLEAEPHRTAKELFGRLRREHPGAEREAGGNLPPSGAAPAAEWPGAGGDHAGSGPRGVGRRRRRRAAPSGAGGHRARAPPAGRLVGRRSAADERLDRVPGAVALGPAQRRADRLGAGPRGARCRPRGARRRQGAHRRAPGRLPAEPGWILRELRRVGSRDPVFVLDEIDKIGARPAGVLLDVLDPSQHDRFHDAFVELPFDLSAVLFITTANEPDRIPPALRDRLEVIELRGYTEADKIAIAETHLVEAQNRGAGLATTPVRFTRGACRRIIRDYTSERGIRQLAKLARCLQTICRKVTLGLETGDAALVRERITARQVRTFLGEPAAERTDGIEHLREQLDASALPDAVRARGRQVLERLSAWAPTDPEHARERSHLQYLLSLPWTARTEAPVDLARARAVLDGGHAAHGAVKERLLDYVAVRTAKPDAPSPLLNLFRTDAGGFCSATLP